MPDVPSSAAEPDDADDSTVEDDGADVKDNGVEAEAESDSEDGGDGEDDIPFGRGAEKAKRDRISLRERPWGRYLRRSALPLLLVASLAVNGFLGWKQWQQHQVQEAGRQAQQAAIAYAQVLTSIDANKVDENFRQVLDGATGEFKDMYTQSSVQLRQLLIDNKASAHGVVVDSAVQSESTDKVVVLVFIDQTVANSQAPDPRIDRSRIKMTMQKVDGRWRAAKVQLL
ncbi:hypothetical protein A5647_03440 [Mycobacterium sp. 1100029.7]|nr:hypothetical protein A5647_03440 [Mycobacterium sp. 1100029.7]